MEFALHFLSFSGCKSFEALFGCWQFGEEFGEERLLKLVKSKSHLPAIQARDEIFHGIEEWCGGAAQPDDITMVVLKVNQAT